MMSIADKLVTISENVPKVYEAGQASMVDESKLIPKTVSGSYISLDDVSEIPHDVECVVSGDGIALETVKISKFGKNLIPYPFYNFTTSSNGITATDLGDGGVLLNGTATNTVFIHLHKTPIGSLYIEGTRTFDVGTTKCTITANKYNDAIRTVHHNNNHLTYIIIDAGTICNNIIFYPQIEVGSKYTEFEKGIPYESLTPNADGTVDGITSVSPCMNIFCDTEGVTLDVTYNKSYGMQTEYDRFWDAFQYNGTRTGYGYAFAGLSWSPKTFKPKYSMNVISGYMMFRDFGNGVGQGTLDLVDTCEKLGIRLTTSNCNQAGYMFCNALISRLGDISLVKLNALENVFLNCSSLETIEKLTFKTEGNQIWYSAFSGCTKLKNINAIDGVIGRTADFSACPLTPQSMKNVINVLKNYAGTSSESTYSVKFTDNCWAALEADSTAPNGDTWQNYVISLGWTI